MNSQLTTSNFRNLLRLCAKFGGGHWYLTLLVASLAAVAQIAAIAAIMPFLRTITDTTGLTNSRSGRLLGRLFSATGSELSGAELVATVGAAFVFIVAVANCLGLLSAYLNSSFVWRVGHNLRLAVYRNFLSRDLDYFLSQEAGASLKNIVSDTTIFAGNVLGPLMSLATHSIFVLAAIAAMSLISLKATGIALLIIVAFYCLATSIFRTPVKSYSASMNEAYERMYAVAEESINNITYVKFHGAESDYAQTFDRSSQRLAAIEPKVVTASLIPKTLFETTAVVGIVIWSVYAARRDGSSTQNIPIYGVMLFACYRLLPACQSFYVASTRMNAYLYSLSEIESYVGSDSVLPQPSAPLAFNDVLELRDVSLRHSSGDGADLKDINLQIAKHDRVCVTGETGCGKTTLVMLLLQLRHPESGTLVVDGKALLAGDGTAWRSSIGYVPQQVQLRHGTIAENVAFGSDDVDMERVRDCCQAADLDTFIEKELKSGYNTPVGDGDSRLSGGQRQRLGIARALYRQPSLLILDEATNALDSATEQTVLSRLSAKERGLTLLLITHREAALPFCNKRFRMDHGQLESQVDVTAPE